MSSATAPVIAGLVLGLSAGLAPGPLLVLTLAQSLRHGAGEGLKVALAPLLTDLPIVAAALLGLRTLSALDGVLGAVGLIGGCYLLYLGFQTWHAGLPPALPGPPASLRRGALVNALSPHPYLFWAMVGGPLVLQWGEEGWTGAAAFVVCFYLCLVGCKMSIALGAGRVRRFLGGSAHRRLMGALALVLAGFGLILVYDAVHLLVRAA
jgi:threonine/homoserine/homoserine lactone efflux protein